MNGILISRRRLCKNSIGYTTALSSLLLLDNFATECKADDDTINVNNYYMLDGWIFSAKDFAK